MTWHTQPNNPPVPIQIPGGDDQPEDSAKYLAVVDLPYAWMKKLKTAATPGSLILPPLDDTMPLR